MSNYHVLLLFIWFVLSINLFIIQHRYKLRIVKKKTGEKKTSQG